MAAYDDDIKIAAYGGDIRWRQKMATYDCDMHIILNAESVFWFLFDQNRNSALKPNWRNRMGNLSPNNSMKSIYVEIPTETRSTHMEVDGS